MWGVAAGLWAGFTPDPIGSPSVEITLQDLLDEIAREGGDLAAYLRNLTTETEGNVVAALGTLETEAVTAFTTLRNAEAISDADVEALETLATVIESIRAETGYVNEQAAEQQARVDALAERIGTPADSADGDDTDADDAPGDGDDADAEGEDADGDAAGAEVVAEAEAVAAEGASVTASSNAVVPRRRVDLARVARRTSRPNPPGHTPQMSDVLLAAAGVPGVQVGQGFTDFNDVAAALTRRVQSYGSAGRTRIKDGFLSLRKEFSSDLVANGADDTEVMAHAANEARLPGGNLIAAAGWCAPSETLYSLCDLGCSLDGMWSAPEILAARGGVRFTPGLDFCEIFNAPGFFHFTEAQMLADPPPVKPCMEIPCPDFQECRLDVDGLCISGDILQRRAYPEVIAQFIEGALCAHAHRVNAFKLNAIATGSTYDGIVGSGCTGATASVLEAIELEVEFYKQRVRRSRSTTLELVAPYWLLGVLRADLSKRNGVELLSVTDAQIIAWMAARGVRPQWVYDWQDMVNCDNPGATPTTWPNEVDLIIYEAGNWIVPSLDVITLDTIYDSTKLAQNKYTALFTEEGFCVIQRCPGSRRFTVPICPDGTTGAQVACACPADVS